MNTSNVPSESTKSLLAIVEADPSDWVARKSAAAKLYEEGCFLEAADMVWNAPEMPSVDMDVAFAVKIVSRARPNRSIRLVYEVLRRNTGKAEQNMAMARAFNLIGLPMLASRFYGAALVVSPQKFDIGFEQQSLWYDDMGALFEAWEESAQDVKKPFVKGIADFVGEPIHCSELPEVGNKNIQKTAPVGVSKPAALTGAPVLRAATPTAAQTVTQPLPATPAAAQTGTQPLAPPPAKKLAVPKPPTAPSEPSVEGKAKPSPMLPPVIKKDPADS